jgi:hypothetical protein
VGHWIWKGKHGSCGVVDDKMIRFREPPTDVWPFLWMIMWKEVERKKEQKKAE